MKATPKQDLPFALSKKDRMADGTPRGLWVSHSPFSWAAFGEGTGPFEVVWRSRYGTNTKFLREVIGPISASNDYRIKVFDNVVYLCGSCRNDALPRSPREKLVVILSLQERNMLFVDRPFK